MTILYVEDEPIIRQVTAGRLGATGARVVEAVDGVDALDQLARLTPDLLLVDLQMPVLDGLGLIRHLRAETPRLQYPLFVLTSHIGGPQAAEAKAAGADVILTKPVQIEPLAAALRAWRGDNGRHTASINRKEPSRTTAEVDAENLRSVFGMLKPDAAAALLEKYEASMRREFATIEQVAHGGDATAIESLAHKPRGMCQIMGAVRLAACLTEIETCAKAGDRAAIITALKDWDTHLGFTLSEMQVLLAEVHPDYPFSAVP
jgi:two-component system chemotaxis response regulator CheY